MSEWVDRLQRLATLLVNPDSPWEDWTPAIDQWYDELCVFARIEARDQVMIANIPLSQGSAIGTFWAASCIKDYRRTGQFVRGIYRAICDQQALHPGSKIRVLYAGTGPFASLVLPLMTLFSPEEVGFCLLEVNPQSKEILERVIGHYGFEAHIEQILEADATTYQLPDNVVFHVAVCETMQHALEREPQVAITMNLSRQLPPDAVFIPQQIIVSAGLLNPENDTQRMMGGSIDPAMCYRLIQPVFDFQKDSARLGHFPPCDIDVRATEGYTRLCLFTTIHLYKEIRLDFSDSGLTLPRQIMDLSTLTPASCRLRFQYRLGRMPGFLWQKLDS